MSHAERISIKHKLEGYIPRAELYSAVYHQFSYCKTNTAKSQTSLLTHPTQILQTEAANYSD